MYPDNIKNKYIKISADNKNVFLKLTKKVQDQENVAGIFAEVADWCGDNSFLKTWLKLGKYYYTVLSYTSDWDEITEEDFNNNVNEMILYQSTLMKVNKTQTITMMFMKTKDRMNKLHDLLI